MWYPPSQQLCTPSSPPKSRATDPDAHAHSPRRRNASREVHSNAVVATVPPRLLSQAMMPPPLRIGQTGESVWTTAPHMLPYHIEARNHHAPKGWRLHMSPSDVSMPDYSHSITPTSSRDPSLHDVHYVHDGSVQQHESQFEELMAAFSPVKSSGTLAPPTTRVSSAANSPPSTLRSSGGPEVRITSFHKQPRAVSVTTRDAPQPSIRQPSDISMHSRFSEAHADEKMEARPMIKLTPAHEVKGRKEGRGSDFGLTSSIGQGKSLTSSSTRRHKSSTNASEENSAFTASDSKRKRASMTSIANMLSETSDGPGSSPSRKVSKKGQPDGLSDSADSPKSPETVIRAPLGSLHNIR